MKRFTCLLMILSVLIGLAACGASVSTIPTNTTPSTTGIPTTPPVTTVPNEPIPDRLESIYTQMPDYYAKLYTYSSEDLDYVIRIYLYEDYTYSIQGSPFSSFWYQGYWQIDGDILNLDSYYFQITEEGLVFLAERSPTPGADIAMTDGAVFTEHVPQEKTAAVSVYALPSDDPQQPAQLYLFESGFFSFAGPAVVGRHRSGSWREEDGVLHLQASREVDNKFNWYFRVEEDGLVFLAQNSSTVPFSVPVYGGDKMILVGDPMTLYGSTFYLCQPASGGFEYNLWLYDFHYYEMAGPDHSSAGYWSIEGETLYLDTHTQFHVTEDGLIYLADKSTSLKTLQNGDFFVETPPCYGKVKAFYYTAPADGSDPLYRFYLHNTSTFSLFVPGLSQEIYGDWTIAEDVVTLDAFFYTEDDFHTEFTLRFRLAGDEAIFLADKSSNVPDAVSLPDGLILELTKAQLP